MVGVGKEDDAGGQERKDGEGGDCDVATREESDGCEDDSIRG